MADEKPAILRDSTFTVEEGFAYRAARALSIWMNKLFFGAVILLAIWLVLAYAQGMEACVPSRTITEGADGTVEDVAGEECSVFLNPTSKYLGAMAILSFLLS
ncbi:MAG TPA: hypothetical protein VFH47_01425, partial [Candidatus Thermoplasmatota archaeon]|nr:hypothetical protein [Candidatus Thermoplasmatota archaeon]